MTGYRHKRLSNYSYLYNYLLYFAWAVKGFNCSITTIMCEDGSYRTVVG